MQKKTILMPKFANAACHQDLSDFEPCKRAHFEAQTRHLFLKPN